MLPGKVPPDILKKIVFSHLGVLDPSVLLGPRLGEDASLIQIGDKVIVVSTDPITGSVEDIGWLVVHVNANDIATFGVAPRWLLVSIMLPSGYKPLELAKIMKQIDEASRELGIAVVGGHSEVTERIDQPIIVGFMMGATEKDNYVTASGARTGDAILLTKTVAIEGTAILATDGYATLSKSISVDVIRKGRKLREQISVVKDGVVAFATGHVHAMHDPTEGGLAGGIHELCDASHVGFEIRSDDIPIGSPTKRICETLEINPLELISSGSMIVSCAAENANEVIRALESEGIAATRIGTIVSDPDHRKILISGSLVDMPRPKSDALWTALKKVTPS
ncbi:MAG: hydrogenase [Candidatus Thorarchaeota archaeon]|nr:MAG: hydrogenase [Candidatus Thorarchaeota archaeon]